MPRTWLPVIPRAYVERNEKNEVVTIKAEWDDSAKKRTNQVGF
jgi:hypothetical protein